MPDMTAIISHMVSPAVIISAVGLLLLSMNNRFLAITARVRDLNSEALTIANKETNVDYEIKRLTSLKRQIFEMLRRCRYIKQAIFLLYIALGFTVLTILTLAGDLININPNLDKIAIVFFILALFVVLVALISEGYEITMALKMLRFDVDQTFESVDIEALKKKNVKEND